MRRPWLAVLFRVAAAALVLWALRAGFDRLPARPSLWLRSPLVFALAKLSGDLTVLAFFRDKMVFFFEDLFWEFIGFAVLGVLAAGLIRVATSLVGGPVEPYFPALVVYLVYLLAEARQQGRAGRE